MLSVVICSHNPRLDYLERTLEALKSQTLPVGLWELVIIDNASSIPISDTLSLGWHPRGRIIREDKLGLTEARLRAIAETAGDTLLFSDDDNILFPDYLERATEIGLQFPQLGVWGAGEITPEFESKPTEALEPFCRLLALRKEKWNSWANSKSMIFEAAPYGAGIVIRRRVAAEYLKRKRAGGIAFGRVGKNTSSSEDYEISLVGIDCELGFGVFTCLRLTHLIPTRRSQLSYLNNLREGISHSEWLLFSLRDLEEGKTPLSTWRTMGAQIKSLIKALFVTGLRGKFLRSELRGRRKAFRVYRQLQKQK